MKIVVGGASGLIGRRLVARLRGRGDDVVALVRKPFGSPVWAQGVRLLQWDGKASGPLAGEVDAADAVVNLAGASVAGRRWTEGYKRQIRDSRILSTRALVDALGKASRRARVFVCASAVGYYGGRGDELLDESAPPGNDFLASLCRDWEEEASKAEAAGARVVQMRTGIVLAREGGALPQMLPPFRAFVGGPLGDGRQWFPWIHIEDEVALFLWAIDRADVRGPLNAASPGIQTNAGFSRTLGKVLGRPSWAKVPRAALRLLVGELANVLTEGQRAVPRKAEQSGFSFRFPDSAAALADLLGKRAPW